MIQWISFIVLVAVILYCLLPNLLVRVFHWNVIRHGPNQKVVALTFDDGPDEQYTPRLLNLLGDMNIRATFFVIAEKAMRNPLIIEHMKREGHDIQIHGLTHAFVPFLSSRRTKQQITESAQVLDQRFGVKTRFYRPTWGLCNACTLFATRFGPHRLVTWSIMVGDWRRSSGEALLQRIIDGIRPGSIIVLHDSDDTFGAEAGAPNQVLDLIPELVHTIHTRGYQFETLSDWFVDPQVESIPLS